MLSYQRVILFGLPLTFFLAVGAVYLWRRREEKKEKKRHDDFPDGIPSLDDETLNFPFLRDQATVEWIKNSKTMFVMRGLPGSGKSTICQAISTVYDDLALVCNADSYRYNEKGEYVWSPTILKYTHQLCQEKARNGCANGHPILVIDNTNVTSREVITYTKMAKEYNYVVVIVEPKTSWKFSPEELSFHNKHLVREEKLKKRLHKYSSIIPRYFGWFLSLSECQKVYDHFLRVLKFCEDHVPHFKQKLISAVTGDVIDPSLVDIKALFNLECAPTMLHCTAFFVGNNTERQRVDKYVNSPSVINALGCVSDLHIIGWTITPRTIGARIKLTNKQLELWDNDKNRKGVEQFTAVGKVDGRKLSEESVDESHETTEENIVKDPVGFTETTIQQTKILPGLNEVLDDFPNVKSEDDTLIQSNETLPNLELRESKNISSGNVQSIEADTKKTGACVTREDVKNTKEEENCINYKIIKESQVNEFTTMNEQIFEMWQNQRDEEKIESFAGFSTGEAESRKNVPAEMSDNQNNCMSYNSSVDADVETSSAPLTHPIQPLYGHGQTAHITLGCVQGVSAVQTGYDLENAIYHELDDKDFTGNIMPGGNIVKHYNEELWVIYLRNDLVFPALFTGLY